MSLSFLYRFAESVFCLGCSCLGIGWWKMVHVGIWSVSGGSRVPAVTSVAASVVRVTSLLLCVRHRSVSVLLLWCVGCFR